MKSYDVVVVGGGPAGLAAALLLSRARKTVLVCDAGRPRNAAAGGVHNFLTRDGIAPQELRRLGRADIERYGTATFVERRVDDVVTRDGGFDVALEGGDVVRARRVILAVGVVDVPPDLPGMREHWGHSAFQCPYCHGWEVRDGAWGMLAETDALAEHARLLLGWTTQVDVFTNGHVLAPDVLRRLEANGLRVVAAKIARLVGTAGKLEHVALEDGSTRACTSLFLMPRQRPTSLVERLKLALDDAGFVKVDDKSESSIPGIYAAGDATTMRQAALAGATAGMMAGVMANVSLTFE